MTDNLSAHFSNLHIRRMLRRIQLSPPMLPKRLLQFSIHNVNASSIMVLVHERTVVLNWRDPG